MNNKIKSITDLLKAFKSRNEKLHEEILQNEEAIEEMEKELEVLLETETEEEVQMT